MTSSLKKLQTNQFELKISWLETKRNTMAKYLVISIMLTNSDYSVFKEIIKNALISF